MLGGLTARAFLVAEPTMAQRLVRAKRKIKAAGIPVREKVGADAVKSRTSRVRVEAGLSIVLREVKARGVDRQKTLLDDVQAKLRSAHELLGDLRLIVRERL
jgi:hypothetical protein